MRRELLTVLPDGVFCRPSVQLLGPPIPVRDDVAHIADENRVMREIEQAGLLRFAPPLPSEVRRGIAAAFARRGAGPR